MQLPSPYGRLTGGLGAVSAAPRCTNAGVDLGKRAVNWLLSCPGYRYRGRVLGTGWTEVVALAAAFLIAVLATPAGISGAVLLLPFQVGVLGTPSPAVTPTNLLYNVIATRPRCTGTGGRNRPAGGWLWCSSPVPCPASSPGR